MSQILDKIIELAKWPVALYMCISLPACLQVISKYPFNVLDMMVLAGFIFFFFCRTAMDSGMRQSMEIVSHELSHALFALGTLHSIKKETTDNGNEVSVEGNGNWLIWIAPYFFPLFGFIAMIGISFYLSFAPFHKALGGILGFLIGCHLDVISSQISDSQKDLKNVGYKFCVMFLPTANLMMIESMLVFNRWGWNGVRYYFSGLNDKTWNNIDVSYHFLCSIF